ncbi:putative betaine lipid synthase protein [Neofusicoccum parvum UCRNP2]|uniref:Putative betaine lipid synthase protein n=1 Tax=Botryosphaeria parva (strain UCR-NP2) TaxID=1287680 RepID=R1ENI7_BOTPV|nr:putative betaine lipid synthase protein [Neofusicoccum parvum UCRNP2]
MTLDALGVLPGIRLSLNPHIQVALFLVGYVAFLALVLHIGFRWDKPGRKKPESPPNALEAYVRFIWGCFIKPHSGGNGGNQQDALEGFYRQQASAYDVTRAKLLHGRDDMLGMVAAQLQHKVNAGLYPRKPVWIDVGGGTGWNIEQMAKFVSVPDFFRSVYLVDLSPSLCEIARARFARLGWANVKVICQDARAFRLADHEQPVSDELTLIPIRPDEYVTEGKSTAQEAELVTMSYALSMIPEFYPVIDSLSSLLCPTGIIGVVDFYVQSQVDFQSRNYVGGVIDRHCMWLSRVFWRTWFEIDRVNLEPARRDYLEYKFGTILNVNARNHFLGVRIPYYVWVGCSKESGSSQSKLAEIDAVATESPFLSALDLQARKSGRRDSGVELHSKAYESAVVNLAASLPLPSSWYQNHHWRIYYDDQLQKHRQFKDEYIYAFTWEDSRVDARLLQVKSSDVILAITSAGDNILSFALEKPKRIHAVDLNPAQNHLLELKVAAFTALGYADVWKLFGEGKHESFRSLLITKLSPHLSSLAFQFWLHHGDETFSPSGKGLYSTGGSGYALNWVGRLLRFVGLEKEVEKLCAAETLNEQREIWQRSIRKVLLSRLLAWAVVGNERWLWKALGVPPNQRNMIEEDYAKLNGEEPARAQQAFQHQQGNSTAATTTSSTSSTSATASSIATGLRSGHAIWEYAVNTLDPVVNSTLLSTDNHYYLLCLQGRYSRRCHPEYLTPKAHIKLSKSSPSSPTSPFTSPLTSPFTSPTSSPRPDHLPSLAPSPFPPSASASGTGSAFDGLRIHTDEINEVLARMAPATLTIAVVMDSMDWFEPRADASGAATAQIRALNRALRLRGRVLLRTAALKPWYVAVFERNGFAARRVAARWPGECIDRVNMYASTWICTKVASVEEKAGCVDGLGRPMDRLDI